MGCGKITAEDFKRRQAFPLSAKVKLSKLRIKEWYEHYQGKVYISFSGGKDSTVLLHLVKEMYPDVPSVFCDTGLEYPEVREFARPRADVILKPKLSFKAVIERYGYPVTTKEQALYIRQYRHTKSEKLRRLRWEGYPPNGSFAISKKWRFLTDAPFEVSEKCCDVMKKAPFKAYEKESGRVPYLGMMAGESKLRLHEYLQNGCNAFSGKRLKSTPLAFWTEQDILHYLDESKIEYASVYGDIVPCDLFGDQLKLTGCKRTGCMFCMFGVHLEKEPNRFQLMKQTHPKQYDYCLDKLGLREVLDYIGVPY